MSVAARTLPRVTWADNYPAERLVDYDPDWPHRYAQLENALRALLGPDWDIEHVGSTSVPGLAAKPVIDLALRVPTTGTIDDARDGLAAAGWSAPVVVGAPRAAVLPPTGRRSAIGHLFTTEQWPQAHLRLFAAWLRDHDDDRQHYEGLKRALLAKDIWSSDYTDAKAEFVRQIVNRARAARDLPELDHPL
jgi:GrpB-like predicted nucleotidyltransferase (UPF0157 family)